MENIRENACAIRALTLMDALLKDHIVEENGVVGWKNQATAMKAITQAMLDVEQAALSDYQILISGLCRINKRRALHDRVELATQRPIQSDELSDMMDQFESIAGLKEKL
jgi:hypothetical protein